LKARVAMNARTGLVFTHRHRANEYVFLARQGKPSDPISARTLLHTQLTGRGISGGVNKKESRRIKNSLTRHDLKR
jgi:hypothetical protein